ncbi:hypothetical protein SDC9_165017 [bioreactor metagenome]|uniref:Uncharacterized protein n=1 Tax=bioreactor metagenome TaxID=1076179 RepID=A0A645FVI9_9ZZZZ
MNFICKQTGLSLTAVIDKAIHLVCLLVSDSRAQDETLHILKSDGTNDKKTTVLWKQLIKYLHDTYRRFPNIDEKKLTFICIEKGLVYNEEALNAIIDCEYNNIVSHYSPEEMELWNRDILGEVPEPNDDGIREDFEIENL